MSTFNCPFLPEPDIIQNTTQIVKMDADATQTLQFSPLQLLSLLYQTCFFGLLFLLQLPFCGFNRRYCRSQFFFFGERVRIKLDTSRLKFFFSPRLISFSASTGPPSRPTSIASIDYVSYVWSSRVK